jgi:prepilin-type N-terminal cleavage/methylation domain-containing protein
MIGAIFGMGFAYIWDVRRDMPKHTKREKGFTLIELMIVVVIIGILAAMAMPRFFIATTKAKQSEARTILKQVYTMQLPYRQQHDVYWGNGTTAFGSTAAGRAGFNGVGVDVETSSRYTYTMVAGSITFTCTATCSNLDDDPAVDTWTIDETGTLTCTSDDAVQ